MTNTKYRKARNTHQKPAVCSAMRLAVNSCCGMSCVSHRVSIESDGVAATLTCYHANHKSFWIKYDNSLQTLHMNTIPTFAGSRRKLVNNMSTFRSLLQGMCL